MVPISAWVRFSMISSGAAVEIPLADTVHAIRLLTAQAA
jgi:hypothetical protein